MLDATSTILVIDDDVDLRNPLGRLLRSVGLNAKLFASVSDVLKSEPTEGPTCLVLDVRFPGQSGLQSQRELEEEGGQARPRTREVVALPGRRVVGQSVCGYGSYPPMCVRRLRLRLNPGNQRVLPQYPCAIH